ncbi:hypothetical protein [Streptomyces sp. S1]|uniref:hypothetical protein n=1 Tax=Streptomyces sp. S1 TaxID=718288 RepID=UPI003D703187
MKIRASRAAALVAVSVLTALAPSQAFAAPEALPCTKENIGYLDAQNTQDDAEARVTAAEQALDRARADRATLDRAAAMGQDILENLRSLGGDDGAAAANATETEKFLLSRAALERDPAATADAAVALADAVDKALVDYNVEGNTATLVREKTSDLRTHAETVRKATEAPHIEARQSDLDRARTEQTEAHGKVRPARDAYRTCLDNLG